MKDFYQFTEDELPFWERFDSVGVQGRAGSLFLWDSRTVHAVRLSCPLSRISTFVQGSSALRMHVQNGWQSQQVASFAHTLGRRSGPTSSSYIKVHCTGKEQ